MRVENKIILYSLTAFVGIWGAILQTTEGIRKHNEFDAAANKRENSALAERYGVYDAREIFVGPQFRTVSYPKFLSREFASTTLVRNVGLLDECRYRNSTYHLIGIPLYTRDSLVCAPYKDPLAPR